MAYMASSGNATVDAMGQIAITGNVTPVQWYKTVLRDNGKPHLLAITILSDLVYWFRPTEVRDERSGQVIGWKKKFSGDKLQKSYKQYENLLGESRRTIKAAFDVLVDLGVIEREFKDIKITPKGMEIVERDEKNDNDDAKKLYNVMFLELNVAKLNAITYPEESAETLENTGKNEVVQNNDRGGTKFCMTSDKIMQEVLPNNVGAPDENVMTSPQNNVPGGAENCGTNTYTTSEIINTENTSLSLSTSIQSDNSAKAKKASDTDVDIDAITAMVNELIVYDLLHKDLEKEYSASDDEFNGILTEVRDILVYEVFAAPDDKRFNFGNREEPDYKSNAIVKNVFRKHLGYGVMKSYVSQYLLNSMPVRNATMYHIKGIYRQCLTQGSQYMSGGRSFFASEGMM